jgi:hypothetical protein
MMSHQNSIAFGVLENDGFQLLDSNAKVKKKMGR